MRHVVALIVQLYLVTATHAATLCVTQPPIMWSANVTQNLITLLECAACTGGVGEPSYCYHDANVGLAASTAGDTLYIDAGTYTLNSGASLNGATIIGAGRLRTKLQGSGPSTALTVYRGTIRRLTVETTGGSAVKILYDQNHAQSGDYNAAISDSKVVATGAGATGILLTSTPAGWRPNGSTVLEGVHVEVRLGDTTTTGVRVDLESALDAKKLYVDAAAAVGIDIVRTGTSLTRVIQSTLRTSGAGNALRRICSTNVRLHDVNFWYVNLLPSPLGRLVKEVGGSGVCVPLLFSAASGIQETSRLEFMDAPIGLGEFRGGAQPFACPGSSASANALGSHWTPNSGPPRVCTATGWRSFVMQ